MSKNKSYTGILFYLFVLVIDILSYFFFEVGFEKSSLKFIEFFVIFLFSIFFLKSARINGILSLYSLFLAFSVFFMYSRIIFEWIGYLGRQVNDFYFFYTNIHFKDRTVFTFMFYTVLYLVSIDFGFYYSNIKILNTDSRNDNQSAKFFILLCIFLCLPLLLYKAYLDVKNVNLNGYESVLDRASYPFYLKGIGTIFISLFYCFFMFKLTKKEILIVVGIYILYAFSASLRGSRSVFFIPFVFCLFLLWKLNVIKITMKKLFVVWFFSILLIAWFTIALRGEKISNLSIGNIFKYILYGQGNSIGMPLYYLEFKNKLDSEIQLPLVIEDWLSFYIKDIFHKGSYYVALIANKNNVEGGLGESVYIELLNLPLLFSIPLSFFIGKTIKNVEKNMFSNKFMIPFFLLISQWLFAIPRFALLNFLDLYGICELILTFFMYIFFNSFSKYFFTRGFNLA